jgi:hypothetical protein
MIVRLAAFVAVGRWEMESAGRGVRLGGATMPDFGLARATHAARHLVEFAVSRNGVGLG